MALWTTLPEPVVVCDSRLPLNRPGSMLLEVLLSSFRTYTPEGAATQRRTGFLITFLSVVSEDVCFSRASQAEQFTLEHFLLNLSGVNLRLDLVF